MPDALRAATHSSARVATVLALLLLAGGPLPCLAGTFVVTTTRDNDEALPEQSTLRQAVALANASPDPTSTITFVLGPLDSGAIELSNLLAPLTVEKVLVIDASSQEDLSIRGKTAGQTLFIVDATLSVDTPELTLVDLAPEGGFIQIADANTLSFDVDGNSFLTIDLSTDSGIEDLPPPGDPPPPPVTGGILLKEGGGTLQLLGINEYTGGTVIREGTVRGDIPSLPGDIDLATTDAALIFENVQSRTFGGDLDGTGLIVKAGTGSLTLSGAGDFSGDLAIDAGALVASTAALPGHPNIAIDRDGTFVFDETAGDQTFAGEVTSITSGMGTLVKSGDATTLTLTAAGDFTGTTIIEDDAGMLVDQGGAIRGDVELGANTTLRYDISQDASNPGRITGSGMLAKAGSGVLELRGDNDYGDSGPGIDTRVEAGTLRGDTTSLKNDIEVVAGTLEFDQASNGTFSGTITGPGTVRKSGSATLVFADPLAYAGDTLISAGQLVVNATLSSPTTVEAAGVLGGTGAIVAPLTVHGTVAPSTLNDPLGALTLDFESGSVFEVDIAPGPNGDQISATGVANLKPGSQVRVLPAGGDYISTPTSVDILVAAGGRIGMFDGVDDDLPFLEATLSYTPTTVHLTVDFDDTATFSSFATTPNQGSVALALDEAAANPTPDMTEVLQAYFELTSAAQVPPTYDAIGGESISGFTTTRLAMGERLERTLHRRMRDVAWGGSEAFRLVDGAAPAAGGGGSALAFAPGVGSPLAARLWSNVQTGRMGSATTFGPANGEQGFGGWLDAWGIFGNLDGDGNSADLDYTLAGTTLGLDYRFAERWIAGLAAGYAYTTFDLDGRSTNSHSNSAQAALYGGYVDPRFYASVSARYAYSRNESERRIVIGSLDRVATGDFGSNDFGARIEAGANVVRFGTVTLQPLAAFDWSQLGRDGFQETGAGALDLDVDSETSTSLLSSIGARLHGRIELDDETSMVPELRAMWLHEYGDTDRIVRGRITGAVTGGDFVVSGAEAPRDSALVGLGWSATIGDSVLIFADYDAIVDSRRLEHNAAITVRVRF